MKNIKAIPYFKFPVQVVFLDDDELFLDSIKKYVTNQNKIARMFSNPMTAYREYLESTFICNDILPFLYSVSLEETDDDEHSVAVMVDYKSIMNLIYDKNRFNEKAVFVVDYYMPFMSGIDFFQKIKNSAVKKIMLTGYSDYKLGVKAFNDGLINKYVLKEINEIKETLNILLEEMIWTYFCDFSEKIKPLSGIHVNEKYVSLFKQWIDEKKIVDFYQCDDIGSYLGLNSSGDLFWFLLSNDSQLEKFKNAAANFGLDTNIADNLQLRCNLLFLFSEIEKKESIENWHKYLFSIQGDFNFEGENYFYSFVDGKSFSLMKDKIFPFKKFISEQKF